MNGELNGDRRLPSGVITFYLILPVGKRRPSIPVWYPGKIALETK